MEPDETDAVVTDDAPEGDYYNHTEQVCRNCEHYRPLTPGVHGKGVCKHGPPTAVQAHNRNAIVTAWPPMLHTDDCGQFESKYPSHK